jgi:hypothetical protein
MSELKYYFAIIVGCTIKGLIITCPLLVYCAIVVILSIIFGC